MPKPQRLPDTGDDHDKVLEAKMAELIGTTTKALQRKRERGIIPLGVWNIIDGRVTYSKRRYDEWVESLWICPKASKSSASPSASASHGSIAVAKPMPSELALAALSNMIDTALSTWRQAQEGKA